MIDDCTVTCDIAFMIDLVEGYGRKIGFGVPHGGRRQLHVPVAEKHTILEKDAPRVEYEHNQDWCMGILATGALARLADTLDMPLRRSSRPEVDAAEIVCMVPCIDHADAGDIPYTCILGVVS